MSRNHLAFHRDVSAEDLQYQSEATPAMMVVVLKNLDSNSGRFSFKMSHVMHGVLTAKLWGYSLDYGATPGGTEDTFSHLRVTFSKGLETDVIINEDEHPGLYLFNNMTQTNGTGRAYFSEYNEGPTFMRLHSKVGHGTKLEGQVVPYNTAGETVFAAGAAPTVRLILEIKAENAF